MRLMGRIKNFFSKRKKKKLAIKEQTEAQKKFLKELESKITNSKKEIETLQTEKEQFNQAEKLGIDSTETVRKKTITDKIRALRIEIVVSSEGRDISYSAKVDGYFISWKQGRKKLKKIIATRPREFETVMIPLIWYRRGLRFYIREGQETTHYPNIGFKLPQAKLAMQLVDAVAENEIYVQIAKAAKGTDRKQLMMWLVTIVIIATVGLLTTGDYFK